VSVEHLVEAPDDVKSMADALNHFTYLLTYLKVLPALLCRAEVRSRDVIHVYYVIITFAVTSVSMTRRGRQASC